MLPIEKLILQTSLLDWKYLAVSVAEPARSGAQNIIDKLQTAAHEVGQSEDGVFVRFARWLERILKK